jgi:8-oxo-dGTP pyrophosphatase MutT (NUDIX family)
MDIFSSPPTGYGQFLFASAMPWQIRYGAGNLLSTEVENGQPMLPWVSCNPYDEIIFLVVFQKLGSISTKAKFPGGCKNELSLGKNHWREEIVSEVIVREVYEETGYIMSAKDIAAWIYDTQFNRVTREHNFFRYFALVHGEEFGGSLFRHTPTDDGDMVLPPRWIGLKELLANLHEAHQKPFICLFDYLYEMNNEARRVIDELWQREPELKNRLDMWR